MKHTRNSYTGKSVLSAKFGGYSGLIIKKVVILGRFQGILLKFHILKIEFLHEKILFFGVDFFLTRYGYESFENELYNDFLS